MKKIILASAVLLLMAAACSNSQPNPSTGSETATSTPASTAQNSNTSKPATQKFTSPDCTILFPPAEMQKFFGDTSLNFLYPDKPTEDLGQGQIVCQLVSKADPTTLSRLGIEFVSNNAEGYYEMTKKFYPDYSDMPGIGLKARGQIKPEGGQKVIFLSTNKKYTISITNMFDETRSDKLIDFAKLVDSKISK